LHPDRRTSDPCPRWISPSPTSARLSKPNATLPGSCGARAHLGALIDRAVATGLPYGDIARVALRLRLGRAPTVDERLREMDRLRQRRRRAVTAGHANRGALSRPRMASPVGSSQEVSMSERLVKRTTVEEFFEDEPDEKACADTADSAEDEEEDEEDED
jgi:hypothetical protein